MIDTLATTAEAEASDAQAAVLLDELEGLVRAAARRPDLVVRTGSPGCAWSFDFSCGEIIVDPESLRTLAPDLCRGLALHEAAHAAVTVLQDFLPMATLKHRLPLLNSIEDIRIELWMRARFPGAVPWIRAYNDLFYGRLRRHPLPVSRQAQFLRGILESWWFGGPSPGTLPEVETALAVCHEAIVAATACQPPLDGDREAILSSQQAMWRIVNDDILPVWDRLAALDRRDGLGRVAKKELFDIAETVGSGGGVLGWDRGVSTTLDRRLPREASSRQAGGTAEAGGTPQARASGLGAGGVRDELAAALGTDGSDAYLSAWKRVATAADRLGDEFLRILVPRRRMRWTTGHPSGPRLDLRRAMQFEADPRLHDSLWSRPVLPDRRNPAIVLLLDRSGSMAQGGLIERSFEGLVLLVEVCRRIDVPAAVWSFASRPREELSWERPVDEAVRQRLGRLPRKCTGDTDLAAALTAVRRAFATRAGDPKLLFVLSDGEPNRPQDTLRAVEKLERSGVSTIGLGLGKGTAGLARFFRCAATNVPTEKIVAEMVELLETTLVA
ncbi:MAG: VWA domain-containing protein [Planctomycetia bacterium]